MHEHHAVGPDQRGGGQPAAQRLLPRAQARAAEQRPPVEEQRGGVAREGLRPRRGDDERWPVGNPRQHQVTARGDNLDAWEGAAEFLGGARRAGDERAQPVVTAARTAPAPGERAAPPAVWRGVLAGQQQRAVARGSAGQRRAPGLNAAAAAGDRGEVAAPRHLDENGTRLQPRPRDPQRQAGEPCQGRRLVPGDLPVVGGRPHPRRGGAHRDAVGGQVPGPAGRDELRQFGCAGEPADEGAGAGQVGAECEHLPGVRVGGARLLVQVVAVIPEHHEAQVLYRGEHGRAGARDDQRLAAPDREPAAVPLRGAQVGGERDIAGHRTRLRGAGVLGARHARGGGAGHGGHRRERLIDAGQVAGVWHHDQGTAAGARRSDGGERDLLRPVGSWERRPGRPGRAAERDRVEKRLAGGVSDPGARLWP